MIDVARMLSDTFAGIAPSSVPMFVLMQLLGGTAAVAAVAVLFPRAAEGAAAAVVLTSTPIRRPTCRSGITELDSSGADAAGTALRLRA